jgi:hypothetical protein
MRNTYPSGLLKVEFFSPACAKTTKVYSTPRVLGTSPFFVRTDTYTTPVDASLTAARQRTFPILWVERSRTGEISVDGAVCLRATNRSDGTAPNAAAGKYSGGLSIWIYGVVLIVMFLNI